ncbi:secretin N-terminal domain-containing protein [Verrucomicrobiota bacterium]
MIDRRFFSFVMNRFSIIIFSVYCLLFFVFCYPAFTEDADSLKGRLAPVPSMNADKKAEQDYIDFSFDQVDVRAFVKLVSEYTGRKFIVSDEVDGKITVIAPQVNRKDVYRLFVSILGSVGCSVVEEEGVCRVVKLSPRETLIAPVVRDGEKIPKEGIITKVIRLKYVSAGELRKVLESRIGGGKKGAIGALEETNHLIITDTAESIRRVEKIIKEVDQPGLSRVTEIVSLQYAGAEDLANQLNIAMAESRSRAQQLKTRLAPSPGTGGYEKRNAIIVAAPHSNSLIIVGTQRQVAEMRRVIKLMDVDTPSGRGRLNAIFLKYISAGEAAKSISALLMKSSDKRKSSEGKKISIEASVVNNALLVDASQGDLEIVKRLIEQIDIKPKQVHIEVLIAELSITDSLDFGVEMGGFDLPGAVGDTVVQGGITLKDGDNLMNLVQNNILPRGWTLRAAHGVSKAADGTITAGYPGVLNIDAVKKDSRINIRLQTALEVQNNKEATVDIVNEIPILKSTIQGGSGTARDVIQNIERLDVGIKLKLKPHIIPGGEVQMVLSPSLEAVIEQGDPGTFTPVIAKRSASTTVIVPDGKTIVIAGLTREDKKKIVRKTPILGSIPILGLLFRHIADEVEKTNVLIFVTPHIVSDQTDSEQIKKKWHKKTGIEEK